MKLKTMAVTYGRKQNLGDFSSAHAEVTLWADLDEGEDEALVMEELRAMARNNVKSEMARIVPAVKVTAGETFAGLPMNCVEQKE